MSDSDKHPSKRPTDDDGERPTEMSPTEARAGRNVPMTWHVLVVSTIVAFAILALIYLVVPWPESQTEQPDQDAPTAPETVQPETDQGGQ